ncbi:MerR family transcriptional regulator [bacterium]|nr:MerR family transcriptional regulator [bacterium]
MSVKIYFELQEVATICTLPPEDINYFVVMSWIEPHDPEENIFDNEDIARIQLIRDLRENMGVNDEAIPVILHLIDQLNFIHRGENA